MSHSSLIKLVVKVSCVVNSGDPYHDRVALQSHETHRKRIFHVVNSDDPFSHIVNSGNPYDDHASFCSHQSHFEALRQQPPSSGHFIASNFSVDTFSSQKPLNQKCQRKLLPLVATIFQTSKTRASMYCHSSRH